MHLVSLLSGIFTPLTIGAEIENVLFGMLSIFLGLAGGIVIFLGIKYQKFTTIMVCGEEQVPPDYGKVFLSIKPSDASFLSAFTKKQIQDDLKKYSVGSVRPVLVDPSILYVEMDSKISFDGTLTELLPQQIEALERGQDPLEKFK